MNLTAVADVPSCSQDLPVELRTVPPVHEHRDEPRLRRIVSGLEACDPEDEVVCPVLASRLLVIQGRRTRSSAYAGR